MIQATKPHHCGFTALFSACLPSAHSTYCRRSFTQALSMCSPLPKVISDKGGQSWVKLWGIFNGTGFIKD